MLVDGVMAFIVIWRVWNWALWAAIALMVPFILIDFTFLGSNLLKVPQGGWVPLLIGGCLSPSCSPGAGAPQILAAKTRRLEMPLEELIKLLEKKPPPRVPGTAVFLTAAPESAPTALLHSLKHYKVLHENNVILTIVTENVPRVAPQDRVEMEPIGDGFMRVILHFGFMETPNIPKRARHRAQGRLELRHHVDLVLPVAALGAARRAVRHARLAGQALHLPRPERRRRIELFPASHRPRGRDRHAGDGLTRRLPRGGSQTIRCMDSGTLRSMPGSG